MKFVTAVLASTLVIAPAAMIAQTTPTPGAHDYNINQRKVDQQDRIANGVKNGSLTPRETARLENKEANLNHEIRHDRKVNGGNLTNKEKAQVNRQQNRLSKDIYRQKHDAQHQ